MCEASRRVRGVMWGHVGDNSNLKKTMWLNTKNKKKGEGKNKCVASRREGVANHMFKNLWAL